MLLRYTSAQADQILLQPFPLPSMSLLSKLRTGKIVTLDVARRLYEKGALSKDVILMADEMYLKKAVQYSNGCYIGADENGNMYRSVVVFKIIGLKNICSYCLKSKS